MVECYLHRAGIAFADYVALLQRVTVLEAKLNGLEVEAYYAPDGDGAKQAFQRAAKNFMRRSSQ